MYCVKFVFIAGLIRIAKILVCADMGHWAEVRAPRHTKTIIGSMLRLDHVEVA